VAAAAAPAPGDTVQVRIDPAGVRALRG
jgi:hypothetical protein